MRLVGVLLAIVLAPFVAPPARADKKLDQAVARAEAQLAKGKPDQAVKELEKAASRARRDPEPRLALADLLSRLGRLEQARAALDEAGTLAAAAPAGPRARVLAARSVFALRAGGAGEALALARQAVEAEGGAASLAALARAQARRGEAEAPATAERAVEAGPASAAAHLARGDALLAAWLGGDAEAAYRRARELAPRSAAAGTGLALALAAQGKAADAAEAARAAIALDEHYAEAVAALGLAALAEDPRDRSGEAVAAVQQASFLEAKNPVVKMAVGRVFQSRGQLEEAAASYGEAARLDPSWAAPPVAALEIRRLQGDPEGASTGLAALPDDLRATGTAQLLLGRLLLGRDPQGARAALDRAVAALPGLAEVQAAHGDAAYELGELTLAADAYGRAADLQPGNLAYRTSHGRFLAWDGRFEEAVSVLLDATRSPESPDPGVFLDLGGVYRSFDPPRVDEAVAAYEQALKLDPKNGEAALGVARSYRAARQWARAVGAYERVPKVNPRLEGESLAGTAWCYLGSGDDYKARFFTGLAARAGADVGALRRALVGSGPGAGPAGDARAELADLLRSKHAGEQVRGVKGLLRAGGAAVPTLASALARPETGIAAREAIVEGLGELGPAAREALPRLDGLVKAGPRGEAPREEKLVGAMREAAGRIRGK